MKKSFFSISLLSLLGLFLLTWCTNNTKITVETDNQDDINIKQEAHTQQTDIDEIIKNMVKKHESCDNNNELFVDIAILWKSEKDNWNTEYYLVANGECFGIDKRWNLGDTSGFGNIPTTIEISQDENWYNLESYKIAKDWSEYDSSTKEMFSDEAYKIRKDAKYTFINDKTLLEEAEEYFGITIIPEWKNNFECKFCNKLWYYEPYDDTNSHTNDLIYNYVSEDNWNNTIYFGSDWSFEAKGSWDEWRWTRTFGQNENTVIVLNNSIDHVYDRYIIKNQDENHLNTILEIIQRM